MSGNCTIPAESSSDFVALSRLWDLSLLFVLTFQIPAVDVNDAASFHPSPFYPHPSGRELLTLYHILRC